MIRSPWNMLRSFLHDSVDVSRTTRNERVTAQTGKRSVFWVFVVSSVVPIYGVRKLCVCRSNLCLFVVPIYVLFESFCRESRAGSNPFDLLYQKRRSRNLGSFRVLLNSSIVRFYPMNSNYILSDLVEYDYGWMCPLVSICSLRWSRNPYPSRMSQESLTESH